MDRTAMCSRSALAAARALVLMLATGAVLIAQPTSWSPRGPGGGGSLFSPSINPANNDEFYVSCDMSQVFHTTDFGQTYSMVDFRQLQGGRDSRVQFTTLPLVRYCITCANDLAVPAKSTDGGITWNPFPGNPDPSETTYGIAADYANPDRVLFSTYGTIFFSADGGTTCTPIHDAHNSGAGAVLAGVLFDGQTIVIGTNDGLLVSTNGGTSFDLRTISGIGADERIVSFAGARTGSQTRFFCLTADSGDVYVGVAGSDYWDFMKGIYVLDGLAGTWTKRMTGITGGSDFPMYVAMAQNDIQTAYLAGSNSDQVPLVLKTTDGGGHWISVFQTSGNANIATGWSGDGGDRGWGYGECIFGLAVAPNNPSRVLISDFGFVHKTTDGGATWQQAYVAAADQHPAGSPTPPKRSYASVGMENTSCWQVHWCDANNMFAAYTDIMAVRSTDAGAHWSFNFTGLSANTTYRIVQVPATGRLYAATSGIHDLYQSTRLQDDPLDKSDNQGKILTSTDHGATWTTLHAFGHPVFWIALDPANANRMYATVVHSTLGGIFVTENLQDGTGATWTKLAAPPRTEGHPACILVLNDGTVVCSFSGHRTNAGFTASSGVFKLPPAASAWTDVSDPGMRYWTKDIVLDPADPAQNTWYVGVFSGWGGPPNGLGGLYKTTNRGTSWMRISDLDRVTSCTINPDNTDEMYVTTETDGLWHTSSLHGASLGLEQVLSYPFRQPERVFFNPWVSGEVWVSSFGGGMMVGHSPAVAVPESRALPGATSLGQNYPNPFNPATTIRVTLGGADATAGARASVVVFDLLGRRVATLMDGTYPPGTYDVRFDARGLASGVYLYQLAWGSRVITHSMLLVR